MAVVTAALVLPSYLLRKDQTTTSYESFQIWPLKWLQEASYWFLIRVGRFQWDKSVFYLRIRHFVTKAKNFRGISLLSLSLHDTITNVQSYLQSGISASGSCSVPKLLLTEELWKYSSDPSAPWIQIWLLVSQISLTTLFPLTYQGSLKHWKLQNHF